MDHVEPPRLTEEEEAALRRLLGDGFADYVAVAESLRMCEQEGLGTDPDRGADSAALARLMRCILSGS